MAGAFGYGESRFAVSRTIGERVLIPAINQSPAETIVIADGFACRAQIRSFCDGRRPLHLAQALDLDPTAISREPTADNRDPAKDNSDSAARLP